ncbi:protein TRANSPARENT TESTA 9-like isoform X3 [Vicia villosa]|uniref:protein TRANSPARENT TESTA 9-like isoform X3 n=1 Tax=Vicia villosa TaxID=3911 RepID=UPI00273A7D71|nr:protein TRANSPARENT TESTA 9-like isoform X3 [Vicia villosa]
MVVNTFSPNSKTKTKPKLLSIQPFLFPFYNAKHQHCFFYSHPNLQTPHRSITVAVPFILIPLLTVAMFSSFWRSIDRFSVQHFKCVITELQKIKAVNKHNRDYVEDLLQCIVEIVTYGDRQDPLIFECFMENQVLADFVRILKTSENSKIEAPLLQYLSIMIQNMESEQAIYYCFSNGYINNIISHPYKFDGGDLASYYVSFLRAISGKINGDTLCLLVKVQGDAVVSFPLYTEALRFAHHEEKMIQTAIRSLVLNIYNVSDDMVYQFILTPPVSEYFSDLVHRLRDLCFNLDVILYDKGREMETQKRKNELILQSDKIVDELYYFKDILSVGKPRLTKLVTENLLNGLVFPALFSLLVSKDNDESSLSAVTSLYIVSRLLQIVGGRSIVNNVACVILYHLLNLNARVRSEGNASDGHDGVKPFAKCLSEIERTICYAPELNGAESITGNYLGAHWEDFMSGFRTDEVCYKRRGILEFVFSEDCRQLLASIFLLLILAESKDLDCFLSPIIGLSGIGNIMMKTNSSSTSKPADGSIFTSFMPEIVNALLKVMEQSLSTMMLWHVGWCLLKLLNFNKEGLNSDNLLQFATLYDQSRAHFLKELDGIWFDHIPDALRTEWESCIRALEQSSHYKNPLLILEFALHQQSIKGETSSYFAWQRMDDAMKAFILHFQLNTFIFKSVLAEKPLLNTIDTSTNDSGANQTSDVSSTSFGSNVSLESGIPCQIAFSNSEIRDVYVIPVAYGMVGKLLLAEKHPFRSRHGVVIAIAPLAGLCPKIDEDHSSWLLLRIRNFDPRYYTIKARDNNLSMADHLADGRWTLGFPNEKACKEAQFAILNEVTKQRSAAEYMLAPLLQNDLGLSGDKGS